MTEATEIQKAQMFLDSDFAMGNYGAYSWDDKCSIEDHNQDDGLDVGELLCNRWDYDEKETVEEPISRHEDFKNDAEDLLQMLARFNESGYDLFSHGRSVMKCYVPTFQKFDIYNPNENYRWRIRKMGPECGQSEDREHDSLNPEDIAVVMDRIDRFEDKKWPLKRQRKRMKIAVEGAVIYAYRTPRPRLNSFIGIVEIADPSSE